MEVRGGSAVVTGGASGLGRATAELLVAAGAEVTIVDVESSAGADVATEIGATFAAADVTDPDALSAAFAGADAAAPRLRPPPARLRARSSRSGRPRVRWWRPTRRSAPTRRRRRSQA